MLHRKIKLALLLSLAMLLTVGLVHAQNSEQDQGQEHEQEQEPSQWHGSNADGAPHIHLYFFWSEQCPHCQNARPFVEQLDAELPWLTTHSLELTRHPAHVRQYISMAETLGQSAKSVPAFLFCGGMLVGFDTSAVTGAFLKERLQACHQYLQTRGTLTGFDALNTSLPMRPVITLPILGAIDTESLSLPVITLVMAGLDAFNPCAFFVLFFLLSLLVNARSRARMLLIGGTFVTISGVMYFLFMAAWLNVFLLIGQLPVITLLAGVVAVSIALINIKDYFWFKQGLSLSIPDGAKPDLFRRMRTLVGGNSLGPAIAGAAGLALFANLYEFLCTAGFPIVFTRILTLEQVPVVSYYFYLALYNVVYVIPLAVIVLVFTITLGKRKLKEAEGRLLKLVSGSMMLCLGLALLIRPELLSNPIAAIGLLLTALLGSFVIAAISKAIGKVVNKTANKAPK